MRIIAGTAKGRRLFAPKGTGTRPTADRVKEAVFSWLDGLVDGADVLDIFAGSGALGLEALSRGSKQAKFIEHDKHVAKVLERNIQTTGFSESSLVLIGDVVESVKRLGRADEGFDIVFCDAPYDISLTMLDDVIKLILSLVLRNDGIVVVEVPKSRANIEIADSATIDTRIYGDTAILYLRKQDRTLDQES